MQKDEMSRGKLAVPIDYICQLVTQKQALFFKE